MEKILITGAAGFIGSHLAVWLLSPGYQVSGLDKFDPYYDPAIKRKNLELYLNHSRFSLFLKVCR